MRHPDEGTIHGWLDGALSPDEAQRLEQHVAECSQCAAAVASARGLIAASTRILGALDAVPAGVVRQRTIPSTADARRVRRSWRSPALAAAAVLLLVAGISTTVMQGRSDLSGALERGPAAPDVVSLQSDGSAEARGASTLAPAPPEPDAAAAAPLEAGASRATPMPAPPPAPSLPPLPQQASAVAERTLQAPSLEAVERPALRMPVTPDTMRMRIAELAVVGKQQGADSLVGGAVAGNAERPHVEASGRRAAPNAETLRLSERSRPAERRAAAAAPEAAAGARPAAPAPGTLTLSEIVVADTNRVQLLVVMEKVDTTIVGVMRTVVYELRPGIHVNHQMVERRQRAVRPPRETTADAAAEGDQSGERTLLRMDMGRVQAIHWMDADGVYHSLSGPVEQEELQRVREALQANRR